MNDDHNEGHSCCHGDHAKSEPEPAPPVKEEQAQGHSCCHGAAAESVPAGKYDLVGATFTFSTISPFTWICF